MTASLARSLTPAEYKALVQPKRSKYNVGPKEQRTYGGRVYASVLECRYGQTLDVWKTAGAVKDWAVQVPFVLHAKGGEKLGIYICDFHVWYADGHDEWVETKGFMTPLAKWKLAHVTAEYNIKVTIVKKLPS